LRKKAINLCACRDSEEREQEDECEDVGKGWVWSREVAGALLSALGTNGGRGGWGRISGIAAFRCTMMNQFRGGSHTGGVVAITEASVCMYTQERKCQL
jgi:hypothetical protein